MTIDEYIAQGLSAPRSRRREAPGYVLPGERPVSPPRADTKPRGRYDHPYAALVEIRRICIGGDES